MNKLFFYFSFALFILLGFNSLIFERTFYVNEILSLCGLATFISYFLLKGVKKRKLSLPHSRIFRYVSGILLLCVVHLIYSLFIKTNYYYYLRNSVIFYSIFTFFIGFYGLNYFIKFISRYRILVQLYALVGLIKPSIYFLDRFTTSIIFPFVFKKPKVWVVLVIILLDVILAIQYGSMTVIIVPVFIGVLMLLPSYKVFKILVAFALIGFTAGMLHYKNDFKKYATKPYALFGNLEAVAEGNKILSADINSTWRAVFWYRMITERFPENLVGIGFGTPLVPYKEDYNTVCTDFNDYFDQHDAHLSGAHNSYLTVAVRLGVLFLLFMLLIFREVFKFFYWSKKKWRAFIENEYNGLLFLSFFSLSIIGLFNLMLETPTLASLFWILLGLIAAVIDKTKQEEEVKGDASQ